MTNNQGNTITEFVPLVKYKFHRSNEKDGWFYDDPIVATAMSTIQVQRLDFMEFVTTHYKPMGEDFTPNNTQKKFIDNIEKNPTDNFVFGRQKGITTILTLYMLWEVMTKPNNTNLIITHNTATHSYLNNIISDLHLDKNNLIKHRSRHSISFNNGSTLSFIAKNIGDRLRSSTFNHIVIDNCAPDFSRVPCHSHCAITQVFS